MGKGIPFSKVMTLIATFCRDAPVADRLVEALRPWHDVAEAGSWHGFRRMVRERPASVAVVDVDAVGRLPSGRDALGEIRSSYPRLGLVLLVRQTRDALALFDLGRVGVRNLVFINVDDLEHQMVRAVARAGQDGATAAVTRALSPYLPRRELVTVHRAMDSVHRLWSADAFAESVDLSRPFLSEVLKARGLPSVGHLLLWTRLMHAGLWLSEPGRTGESVSRQLEYSSGAAFRRALKHYTGATPTETVERGGLDFVLSCFLRACGLGPWANRATLTVA
jgi:AraC-like DNA-binding protein